MMPPSLCSCAAGVDYIKGKGQIAGPNSVSCELLDGGSQEVSAKRILIAAGSEVAAFPGGSVAIDEEKVCELNFKLKLAEALI